MLTRMDTLRLGVILHLNAAFWTLGVNVDPTVVDGRDDRNLIALGLNGLVSFNDLNVIFGVSVVLILPFSFSLIVFVLILSSFGIDLSMDDGVLSSRNAILCDVDDILFIFGGEDDDDSIPFKLVVGTLKCFFDGETKCCGLVAERSRSYEP